MLGINVLDIVSMCVKDLEYPQSVALAHSQHVAKKLKDTQGMFNSIT